MIERYTIATPQEQIEQRFGAQFTSLFNPRYNAAPTQPLPIITGPHPNAIKKYYWGTHPNLSKNKRLASKLINAPIDQLNEKHFYKNALKSRRCLVLADGFYVWKPISKKSQIPYRVALESNALFAMAGLWETYDTIDDIKMGTFTIITQPPITDLENITNDMPVILPQNEEALWLQPTTELEACMQILEHPMVPSFTSYAVAPLVNNLANDGPHLLSAAPPADQFGNYSLFD